MTIQDNHKPLQLNINLITKYINEDLITSN